MSYTFDEEEAEYGYRNRLTFKTKKGQHIEMDLGTNQN